MVVLKVKLQLVCPMQLVGGVEQAPPLPQVPFGLLQHVQPSPPSPEAPNRASTYVMTLPAGQTAVQEEFSPARQLGYIGVALLTQRLRLLVEPL